MGIILDVILIAILCLNIFIGYKKGLVKVIFNLLAFFVALILTFILFRPVTQLVITNTKIDDNIKQTIIEKGVDDKKEEKNADTVEEYVETQIKDTIVNAKNEAVIQAADTITNNIISVIVAICLFIVIRVLLILVKSILGFIADLPIIKQFDKLGGLLYGILTGAIIVYVILTVLYFIVSLNVNNDIINLINNSIISKQLYYNNIILGIFY